MNRRHASSPRSLASRVLSLLLLLTPCPASAAIFWSSEATLVHDAGPRLFLDVTIRSDGPVQGLAVSVHGYDATLLRFDAAASILSEDVLVAIPIGPGVGFGGLDGNTVRFPLTETIENGLGRVPFFEGRQLQGARESGALDLSPITGAAGGPQFRLVFDVLAAGVTAISVSSNERGDAVVFPGPVVGGSNVATVQVVTPEPSGGVLLGMGLLGLARRRDDAPARRRSIRWDSDAAVRR